MLPKSLKSSFFFFFLSGCAATTRAGANVLVSAHKQTSKR